LAKKYIIKPESKTSVQTSKVWIAFMNILQKNYYRPACENRF